VIFGDVNIKTQIERLKEKPEIVIGTAGRIIELIQKKKISAHTIKTVVIDEADKMLDVNNIKRVKDVLKSAMRDTQIVMLSATISDKTLKAAEEIVKAPELIKTTRSLKIPDNIKHLYIVSEARDKIETLRKLLGILKPKRAIAFINNAADIDIATSKLKAHNLNAACIHGTSEKEERQKTLTDFASGKLPYLIATDIAARGLHIENVEVIFSVSITEDHLDYLHRSGRTGRGDAKGMCISIVTERELPMIKKYQNAFHIEMKEIKMYKGEIKVAYKRP
jgi:superfamily II DNA/RNA helicase